MAIASLVVSLAMLGSCMPLSVIGAIFGHVARRQIRERGEEGAGMALAGIIVGWIGFALPLLFVALMIILGVSGVFDDPTTTDY
jgi:hypothetical protein